MNKDAEHEGQHEKWQYVATMVEEEEEKKSYNVKVTTLNPAKKGFLKKINTK